MSEIRVDKIKGTNVGAGGKDIQFDANGNIVYTGNLSSVGTITASNATLSTLLTIPNYATASLPASPAVGTIAYDTDETVMKVYTGSDNGWVGVGSAAGG